MRRTAIFFLCLVNWACESESKASLEGAENGGVDATISTDLDSRDCRNEGFGCTDPFQCRTNSEGHYECLPPIDTTTSDPNGAETQGGTQSTGESVGGASVEFLAGGSDEHTQSLSAGHADSAPSTTDARATPTVSITSPLDRSSAAAGVALEFNGVISGVPESDGVVQLTWTSNRDGLLYEQEIIGDGISGFLNGELSNGIHSITLEATTESGVTASETILIGICGWVLLEDFEGCPQAHSCQQTASVNFEQWACIDPNADPASEPVITLPNESQWLTHRDAYRDCRGWLEMTGNDRNRKGAIFNIDRSLNPGNVVLRFNISTGQCASPTGENESCGAVTCAADGFAASVFNVQTEEDLAAVLARTTAGGGLGYAIPDSDIESFHIEFDTHDNEYDPHNGNHIAIMTNGDKETHHLYYPQAASSSFELEDNRWHEVVLEIKGNRITVDYDAERVLDGTIDGFEFKGGFIGFSGTTGACFNYHRFDNLSFQPSCTF